MLIYNIDDNRTCRGLIECIAGKLKDTSVSSFEDPFAMIKKIMKDSPDIIVIDYDYSGYSLPKGVFEHLGEMDSKFILVSGFDWEFISKDLEAREIDIPTNFEFIRKGSLEIFDRLKELVATPELVKVRAEA